LDLVVFRETLDFVVKRVCLEPQDLWVRQVQLVKKVREGILVLVEPQELLVPEERKESKVTLVFKVKKVSKV